MDTKKVQMIVIGCSGFFLALLFSSVVIILSTGMSYPVKSVDCPAIPVQRHYKLTKQLVNQWHWTYKSGKIRFRLKCPTINYDTDVMVGDQLAARSDVKTFSLVSRTNVRDCHGDKLYVTRTADTAHSLLNLNGFAVSFEIRDSDGDKVLAYVKGKNFFDNDFEITDADSGDTVATVKRKLFGAPWYWSIDIHNQTSPGADMRVLLTMAGHKSFEKSGGDDSSDICNTYFWTAVVILGAAFFTGLCIGIYFAWKWTYGKYKSKPVN